MKKLKFLAIAIAVAFASCNKDDETVSDVDDHDHEEEVITGARLTFNGSTTYSFSDPDGEGGNNPTIDTIRLKVDSTYSVSVSVWNETEDPEHDVTEEISEEKEEHILCFSPTGVGLNITRTDTDANNYEVGLTSSWEATSAGIGAVTVSLKHQPGSKDGTCTPGETDIEVVFPVVIETSGNNGNGNVLIAF